MVQIFQKTQNYFRKKIFGYKEVDEKEKISIIEAFVTIFQNHAIHDSNANIDDIRQAQKVRIYQNISSKNKFLDLTNSSENNWEFIFNYNHKNKTLTIRGNLEKLFSVADSTKNLKRDDLPYR